MMKVKPFSYHIPPRRKAYDHHCGTGTTTNLFSATKPTTCSSSVASYISLSCSSDNTSNRRRRKRSNNSTASTISSYTSISCSCISSSLFSFGGVRTVLILVLLGFIEVAGQGKLSEMHDSGDGGSFPTRILLPEQTRLSHKSLNSLSSVDALHDDDENNDDNDDDYDALQQRISSMGHYGAKYTNASYSYNHSSHPNSPYYHNYYHRSRQYKLEPNFGTLATLPHENPMLSLHEDVQYDQRVVPSKHKSGEIEENKINFQSRPAKLKGSQGEDSILKKDKVILHYAERHTYPIITEPPTPNQTSSLTSSHQNQYLNTKSQYPSVSRRPGSQTQYQKEEDKEIISMVDDDDDDDEEKVQRLEPPTFRLPSSEEEQHPRSELDEYDDEDVLERFIPGNNSHTSGKLRFRQSSQAELDGVENENSLRSRRRPRRSVVHLYDMVVCSTGCNPLIFKGYGCYCGFLGSGLTVDGIDKCCAKHDWCYHHAKCPPLLTYFVPYYWRCDHGRPQCVTDFRGWKGVCGAHLCECDRQFAECLKKFPCPRSRAMCVTSPWRVHLLLRWKRVVYVVCLLGLLELVCGRQCMNVGACCDTSSKNDNPYSHSSYIAIATSSTTSSPTRVLLEDPPLPD